MLSGPAFGELMNLPKQDIEILSNVLQIIAVCTDKNQALESFLNEVVKMPFLPVHPKGGIFLKVPNRDEIKLSIYTDNFSPELLNLCAKIDYGQCLCGLAAQSKKIGFADCVDDNHHITFDAMTPHGHYNIPFFISGGELAGVLVLYVDHGHKSSEKEVGFLQHIAYGLGIICEKFLLHERAVELAMYDVAQTMITSLNHEINNPLLVALGHINIMQKHGAEEKRMNKVEEALIRIKDIVKKIDHVIEKKDLTTEEYTKSGDSKKLKI
jgi:hypothetical protein